MPEGDSVYRVARSLDVLAGRRVVRSDLRVPQHATADLAGAVLLGTGTHGKHLLTRFDDGRTLHTHLRMDGSWTVLGPGKRLPRRLEPEVRVLLEVDDGRSAVARSMPVVELLPTAREADVVGHLGPDLLDPAWPDPVRGPALAAEAVRRLAADPARPLVAALLDQRNLAGLGNLWALEVAFLRGRSPWTPVGKVDLPPLVDLAARMLRFSATHPRAYQVTTGDLRRGEQHWVVGRAGRPCKRCGTPVLVVPEVPGEAGDPGLRRRTWWCPSCQPGPQTRPTGRTVGT